MLIRLAFVLFTSAFVSLIILADRGQIGKIWEFVGMVPFGDKFGHLGLVGTLTVLAVGKRRSAFTPISRPDPKCRA